MFLGRCHRRRSAEDRRRAPAVEAARARVRDRRGQGGGEHGGAVELAGLPNVHALAADTDGIDGSEDNAGAWLAPGSIARAVTPFAAALDAHDAWGFFAATDALVVTGGRRGPTSTTVARSWSCSRCGRAGSAV